jgi:prevent-host-death family protein
MDRVGVRELRQNLSVYLRRVKAGQRLEVTERGQPVARLEPIVDESDPVARLEREGRILRRATGDLSKLRPLKLELEQPLSTIVDELRQDTVSSISTPRRS